MSGPRFSREERAQRLGEARAWRLANKPVFDALYAPAPPLRVVLVPILGRIS